MQAAQPSYPTVQMDGHIISQHTFFHEGSYLPAVEDVHRLSLPISSPQCSFLVVFLTSVLRPRSLEAPRGLNGSAAWCTAFPETLHYVNVCSTKERVHVQMRVCVSLPLYLSICALCVSMKGLRVCMHPCRHCFHVCVYACMYVCMYVCTYVCVYVCMYLCIHVFSYVYAGSRA